MTYPSNVLLVPDMPAFLSARFRAGVNAVCLQRELEGDFDGLARHFLKPHFWHKAERNRLLTPDDIARAAQRLGGGKGAAARHILDDLEAVTQGGHINKETLSVSVTYPMPAPEFHTDWRGGAWRTTLLCTYTGASTQYIGGNDVLEYFPNTDCARLRGGAAVHDVPLRALWKHVADRQAGALPLVHSAPRIQPGLSSPPQILLIGENIR